MSVASLQSIGALLKTAGDEVPDRVALVGSRLSLTYAELDRAVNQVVRALQTLGVEQGDRVAASLRNDAPIVLAFLAAQRLGAMWVGVPRPLAGPEKAYLLADSGAAVMLVEEELAPELDSQRGDLGELRHLIALSGEGGDEWSELVAAQSDQPIVPPEVGLAEIDLHAPAGISYTSGTTGFPKGAVHSQHNLLVPVVVGRRIGKPATVQRQGVMLPLTSLNMMVLGPINTVFGHDTCICISRSDARGIAERIAEQKIASVCVPPTIYYDLVADSQLDPSLLATLVEPISGGTQVPPELVDRYQRKFGPRIVSGYGMTEAPTSVSWTDDADTGLRPGGCGRPLPHLDIAILDESGARLAADQVGEITVAAATEGEFAGLYTPMLEYWNKPEETARALRDGRYHTGDMGYFTADGEIVIQGRRSDLILRGGGNVYPAEVERALHEHPAVGEAVAFGVPDDRLGERVGAAVVAEGRTSEADLLEHCAGLLAAFKRPEFILILPDLPRNQNGKVLKAELVELAPDATPNR